MITQPTLVRSDAATDCCKVFVPHVRVIIISFCVHHLNHFFFCLWLFNTPCACTVKIRAVIVENTFLSVSHMVDELMPFLKRIKWLVLRLKWNSEQKARRLTRPVLYISGKTRLLLLLLLVVIQYEIIVDTAGLGGGVV